MMYYRSLLLCLLTIIYREKHMLIIGLFLYTFFINYSFVVNLIDKSNLLIGILSPHHQFVTN